MAAGSARHLGIHHDQPRCASFTSAGPAWIPAGLQQLLLAAVGLFLIPSILFAFLNVNDSSTSSALGSQSDPRSASAALRTASRIIESTTSLPSPKLIPTYENVDGTEFVWQVPTDPRPKAVLFLAHGCQCRSTFFWDKHPNCLKCTGMPEERTLVLGALARGYAVIAISSTADCWSPQVDTKKVLRVLRNWTSDRNLAGLPVVGLGASSGGYFVSVLATRRKFQSLVIEISSGRFEAMDFDATYPPTLFVHMPRDRGLAGRISEARDSLSEKGVHNDEVLCTPLEVTEHFFAERIPDLSTQLSEKIVASLHQYGVLVPAHDGLHMKVDGRQAGWKTALREGNVLTDAELVKWERHLQEQMNLAYAYHEFSSLPSQHIFDWFDSSVPNVDK